MKSPVSFVKKVGSAGNCDFPTDTANFRQEIIGTQSVNFAHTFAGIGVYSAPNVAFWTKIIPQEVFPWQPKIGRGALSEFLFLVLFFAGRDVTGWSWSASDYFSGLPLDTGTKISRPILAQFVVSILVQSGLTEIKTKVIIFSPTSVAIYLHTRPFSLWNGN